MSEEFYNQTDPNPKLTRCRRLVSSIGGENFQPVGECFVKTTISKNIFRGRVIVIKNLSRSFILGVTMQRANRMGMAYSTDGRHFITIKGKVNAQSCQSTVEDPSLNTKGQIILKPNSISVVAVKTPKILDTEALYEVN